MTQEKSSWAGPDMMMFCKYDADDLAAKVVRYWVNQIPFSHLLAPKNAVIYESLSFWEANEYCYRIE